MNHETAIAALAHVMAGAPTVATPAPLRAYLNTLPLVEYAVVSHEARIRSYQLLRSDAALHERMAQRISTPPKEAKKS